jgi:hypothetical protein
MAVVAGDGAGCHEGEAQHAAVLRRLVCKDAGDVR